MRILVVAQHFWPELGGAEVMLHRLACAWAGSGHAVTAWAPRWHTGWPTSENVPVAGSGGFQVVRHPVSAWRALGAIGYVRRLRGMLRAQAAQFDVAYVSMFKHAAYALCTAGTALPVVVRAEGAGSTGDMAWQRTARFGGRIRQACQQAAAFVAPGVALRDELIAAGYDNNRMYLIHNGVNIPRAPWRREEAAGWRAQLNLPDQPTAAFTGRLHAQKGIFLFNTPRGDCQFLCARIRVDSEEEFQIRR